MEKTNNSIATESQRTCEKEAAYLNVMTAIQMMSVGSIEITKVQAQKRERRKANNQKVTRMMI